MHFIDPTPTQPCLVFEWVPVAVHGIVSTILIMIMLWKYLKGILFCLLASESLWGHGLDCKQCPSSISQSISMEISLRQWIKENRLVQFTCYWLKPSKRQTRMVSKWNTVLFSFFFPRSFVDSQSSTKVVRLGISINWLFSVLRYSLIEAEKVKLQVHPMSSEPFQTNFFSPYMGYDKLEETCDGLRYVQDALEIKRRILFRAHSLGKTPKKLFSYSLGGDCCSGIDLRMASHRC